MAKCSVCGMEFPDEIKYKIFTKDEIRVFCPNCLLSFVANGELDNLEGDLLCEITGKTDALAISDSQSMFVLTNDVARRLIMRNLHKDEYKKLIGDREFLPYLLHDDFYDEDGNALCPAE